MGGHRPFSKAQPRRLIHLGRAIILRSADSPFIAFLVGCGRLKSFASQAAQRGVKRLLGLQVLLVLLLSLLWLWGSSLVAAYSAFLGGAIAVVANGYFAMKVLARTGALAARQIVRTFYIAEAVKLLLSAVLFILVFVFIPVRPLPLFLTYVVVQMGFWAAPWCFSAIRIVKEEQ